MNALEKKARFPLETVLVIGIPALCLIACAALIYYYWVEIRPLDAWPKDPVALIEARWELVEELARTPDYCGSGGDVLDYEKNDRVMSKLDESRKSLEQATDENRAPLLSNLGEASRMQRCGDLVETLVGSIMSMDACEYARDNGIPVAEELAANRFDVEDILPAIARDVVRTHRMIEKSLSPLDGETDSKPGDLVPRFDTKRERMIYKQFYADLFQAAKRHRGDPEKLAEIFEGSEDFAEGRSRLQVGIGLAYSGAIAQMSRDIEKFDECVASVGGKRK